MTSSLSVCSERETERERECVLQVAHLRFAVFLQPTDDAGGQCVETGDTD